MFKKSTGRPSEFDDRVVLRVDAETRQWLSTMALLTGESESWVLRHVINFWRTTCTCRRAHDDCTTPVEHANH